MSTDRVTDAQFRVLPSAYAVELDGELLIWDETTQQLHRLNPTATRIWQLLSSWRSGADVTAALSDDSDAVRARVADDVARCVDNLATAGLLETRTAR
jgi:hypothetical protein